MVISGFKNILNLLPLFDLIEMIGELSGSITERDSQLLQRGNDSSEQAT